MNTGTCTPLFKLYTFQRYVTICYKITFSNIQFLMSMTTLLLTQTNVEMNIISAWQLSLWVKM